MKEKISFMFYGNHHLFRQYGFVTDNACLQHDEHRVLSALWRRLLPICGPNQSLKVNRNVLHNFFP